MAVGSASGAAAAAAAARAAEIARQKAAAEAARRAAEAAAKAAAAAAARAAAAKAAKAAPLHPKERPTKNRNAFVDLRPLPKVGPAAAPIRERPTRNRSAFVVAGAKPARVPREIEEINEAAQKSPEAGARALEQRLKQTTDAQEREKVLSHSYGAVDTISGGLRQPGVTQEQTTQTIAALGSASQLLSSDGGMAIATRLQQGAGPLSAPSLTALPSLADTAAAETRLNTALKANASAPGVASLAGKVADSYRVQGNSAQADAISALSPQFKSTAAQTPGEARARAAVEVPSVADERANLESKSAAARLETTKKANDLIALSQKDPSKLPKGVSVEAIGNGAVVTQTDASGNVVGRTTAEIDGTAVRLQEETYAKGQVSLSRIESTPDALSTTTARFAQAPSKAPPAIDVEALKERRDAAVTLDQQTVSHDGDNLLRRDLTMQAGGVSQSDTRYSQHDNTDGLDDKLKGKFSDATLDYQQTHTYTIPPPGEKGAKATYARTQVFSQGDARATATAGLELGERKSQDPSNADDVAKLKETNTKLGELVGDDDVGEDFDGNAKSPKQWTLEVNTGNTYKAQTFVEGNPDASTVLTRTAIGNEVHEEVSGKAFNKDGKLGDISGNSSRTWTNTGTLSRLDNHVVDADGNVSDQRYARTLTIDAQGRTEIQTRSVNSQTPVEGPATSAITSQVERPTKNGNALVSARQEVHGPGGVAVATLTPKGQTLSVNGQTVKSLDDLKALGADRAHLGAAAADGVNDQLKIYAARRGVDPAALATDDAKPGDAASNVSRDAGWARSGLNLLQKPLTGVDSVAPSVNWASQQKLTGFQFSSSALGATADLVGVAGGAVNLVDAIRTGDGLDIASAGLSTAGASAGLVGNVAEGVSAIRAGGAATSSVASIAGKFTVGIGVAAGGVQIVEGIRDGDGVEIAKGGVAVTGAVGGFVLGGAAAGAWGGPAGIAVGALVGVAAFGVTELIDGIADKEHQIADVQI